METFPIIDPSPPPPWDGGGSDTSTLLHKSQNCIQVIYTGCVGWESKYLDFSDPPHFPMKLASGGVEACVGFILEACIKGLCLAFPDSLEHEYGCIVHIFICGNVSHIGLPCSTSLEVAVVQTCPQCSINHKTGYTPPPEVPWDGPTESSIFRQLSDHPVHRHPSEREHPLTCASNVRCCTHEP